jgi:CheY-like chemotaxis protein
LYIEDNIPNTELVEQIILENRPNIELISDMYGENAVKLAIENKPFLILLDLNLPDMHGSQVIKLLKQNDLTKKIPVVILSADAMPNKVKKLKVAGAGNYLIKPLIVSELLDEIDKYHKPLK